jgi:hypothetical protein
MINPNRSINGATTPTIEQTTAAVARAVRLALLRHAREGRPVPIWENGRVVWLSPEETFARLAAEESLGAGEGNSAK